MEKLIKELNDLKILQNSVDWAESLPTEIWEKYFKEKYKELNSGLDVHKHRWYETSISVIEIDNKILGIKHLSDSFSESQMIEDCFVHLEFFEMKVVTITTYKRL
jgi:hypothetical protein